MGKDWIKELREEFGADYEEILDFLDKKGAVEMLCLIEQEPKRFDEIVDALNVSRATVNERRLQALNLDLIEPIEMKVDGSLRRGYNLTGVGSVLGLILKEKGVTRQYERLQIVRDEYETAKKEFLQITEEEFWVAVRHHAGSASDSTDPRMLPRELRELFKSIDKDEFETYFE